MKATLRLLACICLTLANSFAATAQIKITPEMAKHFGEIKHGPRDILPAPKQSKSLKTAKITTGGEPLLSKAYFKFNGVSFEAVDSSRYNYSAGRTCHNTEREDSIFYDRKDFYLFDKSSAKYIRVSSTNSTYLSSNYINSKLDSSLDAGTGDFPPLTKLISTYDASFNKTSDLIQVWNVSTNTWDNDEQYTYTYDAANYMVGNKREVWDMATAAWVNEFNILHTYNAAHSLLTYAEQYWDGSAWLTVRKESRTFDAAEHELTYEFETYDFSLSALKKLNKTIYTYTASGKVASSIGQNWKPATSSYQNSGRTLYTYDASDRLIESAQSDWIPASSTWLNNSRTFDYTYNASGQVTFYKYYNWLSSTWTATNRFTTTYDASGNVLVYLSEYYEPSVSLWGEYGRETSTYNATNDKISFIESYYDFSTGELVTKRNRSTYNGSHQLTRSVNDHYDGSSYYYQVNDQLRRYHYTETSGINIEAVANIEVSLYPVPANEQCAISLKWASEQDFSIALYDALGRIWLQEAHRAQSNYTGIIETKQLPSGNYFVSIQNIDGSRIVKSISVMH